MTSWRKRSLQDVRVIDGCGGHERQAVSGLHFDGDSRLYGVLQHDPIVFAAEVGAPAAAWCELECDARFDPAQVLFSPDGSAVLVAHREQLRMHELASGQLLWKHDALWWELFFLGPSTLYCLANEGSVDSGVRLDVRSGAASDLRRLSDAQRPPMGAVSDGEPVIFPTSIASAAVGSKRTAGMTVTPSSPREHLYPHKARDGALFLCLNAARQLVRAMDIKGAAGWRYTGDAPARPVALLERGHVIVCCVDTYRGAICLVDGLTGKQQQLLRVPIEQAEGLTVATVHNDGATIAIGTSLGRVIVARFE